MQLQATTSTKRQNYLNSQNLKLTWFRYKENEQFFFVDIEKVKQISFNYVTRKKFFSFLHCGHVPTLPYIAISDRKKRS